MYNMRVMQNIYPDEDAAREAARKLGETRIQIVQSKRNGYRDPGPWVFYLETPDDRGHALIRSWESLVYLGKGRDA